MAGESAVYAFSRDELDRVAGNARDEVGGVSGEYEIVTDPMSAPLPSMHPLSDWLPPIGPERDE